MDRSQTDVGTTIPPNMAASREYFEPSMGLVVRTIGIARATVKIGLANITYNMRRAVWLVAQRVAAA